MPFSPNGTIGLSRQPRRKREVIPSPFLKDTIAILKGRKGRPKLKPSQLEKGKSGSAQEGGRTGSEQKRAGSAKRQKTVHLKIDQTEIIRPAHVPLGSVFKGYEDYVVQEL